MKYPKAKIYKYCDIFNEDGGVYVGYCSTSLKARLKRHLSEYKYYIKTGKKYNSAMKITEVKGCIDVVLIENFPCNSLIELKERQGYWIEKLNAVNSKKHIGKYYNLNKSESAKVYYQLHKERFKRKKIMPDDGYIPLHGKKDCERLIECECGRILKKKNLPKHCLTNVHTKLIQKKYPDKSFADLFYKSCGGIDCDFKYI
jgi:hypothetical protein